jgi:hypothetical protein
MIGLLEPLFQGDLAPHGEALQCAPQPPADALRVADLVRSPELLGRLLRLHAAHLGVEGKDLRAVASAWSLGYLGLLLPPVSASAWSSTGSRLRAALPHRIFRGTPARLPSAENSGARCCRSSAA